jgi:maltose O-acetyltransferase
MADSSPPAFEKLLQKSTLATQLWTKFTRDQQKMPLYVIRRKALRYLEGLALSPLYLRHCTKVGKRARTRGMPFIENLGRIVIGNDFNFVSLFVQSHLVTGHDGLLEIGDTVNINFGAAISAHEHVKIGDRVRIGPYAIIMDSDYHTAKDRSKRPTAPVIIEDDVWLAGRVSVLRGSRIGKGSVVTAGSVVSGEIPAGVIAGGVPARVLRRIEAEDRAFLDWSQGTTAASAVAPVPAVAGADAADGAKVEEGGWVEAHESAAPPPPNGAAAPATRAAGADDDLDLRVKSLIAETFSLEGNIDPAWGPKEIPRWDSLGQLRLTFSLEEQFKINISETELTEMTSVGQVCRIVRDCVARAG